MKHDGQRYLDLAVRWAPFGGPRDEDIFVNFGVHPRLYFSRVHRMIENPQLIAGIADPIRAMVHQNCEDRLRRTSEPNLALGLRRPHNQRKSMQR